MKTLAPQAPDPTTVSELVTAAEQSLPRQVDALARARAFAEPLIAGETLESGENVLAHADAVAAILKQMGGSEAMQAASYLVYACPHLNKPREVIAKFKTMQMVDVCIPTTDGRELVLSRYTQPEAEHRMLLDQLRLTLPQQPPPKITAKQVRETILETVTV